MKILVLALFLVGCEPKYRVIDMKLCHTRCEEGVLYDKDQLSEGVLGEIKSFCKDRFEGDQCCAGIDEGHFYPQSCSELSARGREIVR